MERKQPDPVQSEPGNSNASWWSSDLMEKLQSLSLVQGDEANSILSNNHREVEDLPSWKASQILWTTGRLSQPIPDGFYSILMVSALPHIICLTHYNLEPIILCYD